MNYQPRQYGLLSAPVSPTAAKAFVAWFSRETVLTRSAMQAPEVRDEIRAAWYAIETMAKVFDDMRQEERPGHALPPAVPSVEDVTASAGMSVQAAAEAIGCTTGRVRQLLRAGTLEGSKAFRGCWMVDPDSVAAFRLVRELAA